ncbi:MAG: formate dehydrogenase accessory sulfurtransferase FdhD [Armatimonadota bacterium]
MPPLTHDADDIPATATREVAAVRLTADGQSISESCRLVAEQPLVLAIEGVGEFTLMCTPHETMALAVGFAVSEGIIAGSRDINLLYRCEDDPTIIRMQLAKTPENAATRNLIATSSCGICGTERIEELIAGLPSVEETLHISLDILHQVMREMRTRQRIFAATGGTHAAAIFSADGSILAFAEDVGRHNALDKVIGLCCLAEKSPSGCGVALSGRVSLEMVAKSARAGIELIGAVSAPTTLALDTADRCGITLCGFVREDRATVYSHCARIIGR